MMIFFALFMKVFLVKKIYFTSEDCMEIYIVQFKMSLFVNSLFVNS
jgi:hypothetical protein